ncbi:MAG: PAS domain S-box protein [Deltaproteobacteria bacterium]|nr:PAS domain S-box protein [Deltaproteobacteria bacterium]
MKKAKNSVSKNSGEHFEPNEGFRLLFEINPHPLWVYDLETLKFLAVNDAAVEKYGYSREEFFGMTVADIFSSKKLPRPDENSAKIFGRLERAGLCRHRLKDGSLIDVEITSHSLAYGGRKAELVLARDVRAGDRAQQALHESEERFRQALENIPDVIVIYGPDLKIRYINEATRRLTGMNPEDFIGKRDDEIWPPGVYQVYIPELKAALEERSVKSLETDLMLPGGQLKKLRITCVPLLNEEGGVREVLGITTDLTEQKDAEHSLKLAQFAIEEASFACIWLNSVGRIIYVNKKACTSLDYSRDELLNMSLHDINPEIFPEDWSGIWSHLTKARIHSYEALHQRKNGSLFPVEVTANYLAFDGKKYSCAYVRDLSEERRAVHALRESEERLRQAVRVAHIGIFDYEHLTERFFASPEMRAIFGWASDEPLALDDLLKRTHPDDREKVEALILEARDTLNDNIFDVEIRFLKTDGSLFFTTIQTQAFFSGKGERRHWVRTVGAVHDISDWKQGQEERQKLQAQLLQAQKMESVGRLAGGVAHDFNNMLNVILGHSELAMDKLEPSSPVIGDLRQVQMAAQCSTELARQLLAFGRRQAINPKVLDLNDTLAGMLKMLGRLIGEDIKVVWKPDAGLLPVNIDPAQVDQILANLLVNARDAISGKGRIVIETKNVFLDGAYCRTQVELEPGAYVMISVSDDGHGMDEETLSHLFEPFYTTKSVGSGTGLGLATVYGIVKQNKGCINVYSEPNLGSTFKIFLPCHETEETVQTTEDEPLDVKGGNETILLVEDDPMVLRVSEGLLQNLGYNVIAANSPDVALRIAEEKGQGIELLITDVIMPEMNGKELSQRLSAAWPHLKTLYISGYTADVIAHRGLLEQGAYFLPKPFFRNDLASKVREVLESASN